MLSQLSYEKWKAAQELELAGTKIKCPLCDGEGEYEEECECCGHEREIECDLCDFDGMAEFDALPASEKRKLLSHESYLKASAEDVTAMIEWLGQPGITIAVERGFLVYTDISRLKNYGLKRLAVVPDRTQRIGL